MLALMRRAIGVVNPSRFEGWSTTVEEAKSLGVPAVLSDLAVHREQALPGAVFFDPQSPAALAAALISAWESWPAGPRPAAEQAALAAAQRRRQAFAARFAEIAAITVARKARP